MFVLWKTKMMPPFIEWQWQLNTKVMYHLITLRATDKMKCLWRKKKKEKRKKERKKETKKQRKKERKKERKKKVKIISYFCLKIKENISNVSGKCI